jgi:hypothetical protein
MSSAHQTMAQSIDTVRTFPSSGAGATSSVQRFINIPSLRDSDWIFTNLSRAFFRACTICQRTLETGHSFHASVQIAVIRPSNVSPR